MTRRTVAAIILLLWLAGLGILANRELRKTDSDRLAEAAVRVEPAAYYYRVYQDNAQVGVASSVIDTSQGRMRATDSFYGRLAVNGDTQAVEGSAVSYLSRRLALDSFAIAVRGDRLAQQWRGAMNGPRALIVLPTMAPIVLMMTGDPAVGREASYEVYNPQVRKIQRMTFRILAESLFTVSDSSAFDSTTARWVSAHRDTVRAWSVAPHASGFTVWVDAQGRVVSGSAPAGLRIERAAYEETFSNWRKEHQ